MWKPTPFQRNIIIILVVGIVVRYILGILLTYPRDIASWVVNSENFLMGGGLYGLPGHYYTPVWGYVMAFLTSIAAFAGIPLSQYVPDFTGSINALPWYTTLPTIEYALLIKTFLFIIDILVGYVIYKLVMHMTSDQRLATIAFAVWFLCPLTIIVSAIRVMFENLEILFLLLSVLMMVEKRPDLAGVMMGLSLLVKPYGMFLGILLIGYAYAQTRSVRYSATYLLFTAITGLVVMLPVILSGDLDEAMIWLSVRADSIGSGYNVTLLLMPFLILLSAVSALVIANLRMTNLKYIMALALAITGAMLVFPGNVQYYLLLLPLAILMVSRWCIPVVLTTLLLSFYAGVSFTSWSAGLYIADQFWGWESLEAFGDFLYPYESSLNYDDEKALAGYAAVFSAIAMMLYARWRSLKHAS